MNSSGRLDFVVRQVVVQRSGLFLVREVWIVCQWLGMHLARQAWTIWLDDNMLLITIIRFGVLFVQLFETSSDLTIWSSVVVLS